MFIFFYTFVWRIWFSTYYDDKRIYTKEGTQPQCLRVRMYEICDIFFSLLKFGYLYLSLRSVSLPLSHLLTLHFNLKDTLIFDFMWSFLCLFLVNRLIADESSKPFWSDKKIKAEKNRMFICKTNIVIIY